jgi:hypothetical protein
MAIEKTWLEVPAIFLLVDGTTEGELAIPSTLPFKVKQRIFIRSNTLAPLELEIKRITSNTLLQVGSIGKGIKNRVDLSQFTLADTASIFSVEQSRPAIPPDDYNRAVYEEEPTVALRTILVDPLGNKFSKTNPVPVQLSDGSISIGTVNAELEVQLSHKNDTPNLGDIADSVRIGDGINELNVNSDGSLNVVVQTAGTSSTTISVFNQVSSVANGVLTDVVTYTVPGIGTFYLNKLDYSGDNIARFQVELNSGIIDIQRTFFAGGLNGVFDFANGSKGLVLTAGDILKLRVFHARPTAGDFSGRIQLTQS